MLPRVHLCAQSKDRLWSTTHGEVRGCRRATSDVAWMDRRLSLCTVNLMEYESISTNSEDKKAMSKFTRVSVNAHAGSPPMHRTTKQLSLTIVSRRNKLRVTAVSTRSTASHGDDPLGREMLQQRILRRRPPPLWFLILNAHARAAPPPGRRPRAPRRHGGRCRNSRH